MMNYILPEDAYRAYQNKEILPYLKIPYEITSQGQWVNIDPNYQIYCDEFRESYEKLKSKNTLDLFMDLLVFSVEHPCCSTSTIRSTGGRGGRRRWRKRAGPTGRSCCRSATPPAIGAM